MKKFGTVFISHFQSEIGTPMVIDENNAVYTICAREDMKTGGHATCYLEWMEDNGLAEMRKYHLTTPGYGRVQLNSVNVQVLNDPKWEKIDIADKMLEHLDSTKYHSYQISREQVSMLNDSFLRFMVKNLGGRYAYSLPGGKLGRILQFLKGKRGVNCADLTLKLLNDAGISNVGDKLINTPRYSAGSSNR